MNPFRALHERWLAWQEKRAAEAAERERARKQSGWQKRIERVVAAQREQRRKEEATMRDVFPEDAREDDMADRRKRGRYTWRDGKVTRWR